MLQVVHRVITRRLVGQASHLSRSAGLVQMTPGGKPMNGWAGTNEVFLHAHDDTSVFVIGDAVRRVSPLFSHYPKVGHVAIRHHRLAANRILALALAKAKEMQPLLPDNLRFMLVNGDPREAIQVRFKYMFKQDMIKQTQIDVNERTHELFVSVLAWVSDSYRTMFGS